MNTKKESLAWSSQLLSDPLDNTTHVVTFPLSIPDSEMPLARACLSADEQQRADRYVFEDVRDRFVVCRFRVRQLLGKLLGIEPQDVRFAYSQWGKPKLETLGQQLATVAAGVQVHFNVSHSGEAGALAVSRMPVGIDVEVTQKRFDYRSIISLVVSEHERGSWNDIAETRRDYEMMRLWVCKEALLKAMGLGIAEGLMRVGFPLPIPTEAFVPSQIGAELLLHLEDDGTCAMNNWIDTHAWRLQMLSSPPDRFLAIATAHSQSSIVARTFESMSLA